MAAHSSTCRISVWQQDVQTKQQHVNTMYKQHINTKTIQGRKRQDAAITAKLELTRLRADPPACTCHALLQEQQAPQLELLCSATAGQLEPPKICASDSFWQMKLQAAEEQKKKMLHDMEVQEQQIQSLTARAEKSELEYSQLKMKSQEPQNGDGKERYQLKLQHQLRTAQEESTKLKDQLQLCERKVEQSEQKCCLLDGKLRQFQEQAHERDGHIRWLQRRLGREQGWSAYFKTGWWKADAELAWHVAQTPSTGGGLCCICIQKPSSDAFMPCGHVCTCSGCAEELVDRGARCPLCRKTITGHMEIFFV